MYRLFIADDEQIILNGISKAIEWENIDLQLAGTAQNGIDALQMIKKCLPDIVITDIRMPFMDGLELIENIHQVVPECKIVIVTGHDDFEYAQKAIRLGVSDYVLKPINTPSLYKTLLKIKCELDEVNHKTMEIEKLRSKLEVEASLQTRQDMLRYFTRIISSKQFIDLMPEDIKSKKYCAGLLFQIDDFDGFTASMNEEEIFDLIQSIEDQLYDLGNQRNAVVIDENNGRYFILFIEDRKKDLHLLMNSYIRNLRMTITNVDFTTANSPVFSDICQSVDAYKFVCKSIDYVFLFGHGRDIKPEDIQSYKHIDQAWGNIDINQIIKTVASFDKLRVRRDFNVIAKTISKVKQNSYLYTRLIVSLIYGEVLKLASEMNCPIQDSINNITENYRETLSQSTLDDMIDELYNFVCTIYDFIHNCSDSNNSIVEKSKQYIEEHFAEPKLTLGMVARAVHISPSYLSALFKQTTGQSFINYLTATRLEAAKRFLMTGGIRSYEVAIMIGYENPTYFSTMFKRHIGVSPSEYRKHVLNEKTV